MPDVDPDRDRLFADLIALVAELAPDAGPGAAAALRAEREALLEGLLEAPPGEDERSLSRTDLYRIRIGKIVARSLPAALWREPATRHRVRARARALACAYTGDDRLSRYLDTKSSSR